MRILLIGQSLDEHSGWGRYAWEVVKCLRVKHQVTVLVEHATGKPDEHAVLSAGRRPLDLMRSTLAVRRMRRGVDIVHALDGYPYALYAHATRRPYVVSGIGAYTVAPLDHPLKRLALSHAYRRAKAVLCISNFVADQLRTRLGLTNLGVVHLGVDHNRFQAPSAQLRTPNLVISVGHLKPRKGHHVALRAVAAAIRQIPDLRYVIVGKIASAPYAELLLQQAEELGIAGHVEIRTSADDAELLDLYRRASLFMLLPQPDRSHFEGFGLVFVEAAACGLPVIGTSGSGVEDAVADGRNGTLVTPGDADAAAKAMVDLLTNSPKREAFAKESLEFAKTFSWEKTVEQYEAAYRSVIASPAKSYLR